MTADAPSLLLACFCAQWCGTCRSYEPVLREVMTEWQSDASLQFAWIDIEDHAEVLGDIDVENFPTLLLVRGDQPLFFGTVTPHAATLARLVREALAGSLPAVPADDELRGLVERARAFAQLSRMD